MRRVFLSYCHDDADFVHILKGQLDQAGFSTWKDLDLRAGDNWHSEIEDAIRSALAVVLVLSDRALASPYVNFEWAFALGAGVPIVPLLLKVRPESLHPRLSALQALDFTNYMTRPWDSLTQSLKALGATERPFTLVVPRDAPPFIHKAAAAVDSLNPSERKAAITVLSQVDDLSAREVLAEALRHPAPDVRDLAVLALKKWKDTRAIPAILDAFEHKRFDYIKFATLAELGDKAIPTLVGVLRDASQSVQVREGVAYALGDLRDDASVEALHELLAGPEHTLRIRALQSLAGDPRALPWILEAAQDKDLRIIETALQSLRKYRGPEIVAIFAKALSHEERSIRGTAAQALEEIGDDSAGPALVEAMRDSDNFVRSYAARALRKVGDASLVPALLEVIKDVPHKREFADILAALKGDLAVTTMLSWLKSEDRSFRVLAAYALARIGDRIAVPALILALQDEDDEVRQYSAVALGDLKATSAVPDLIKILQCDDEFEQVMADAAYALNQIGTREARVAYREWERKKDKS